MKTSWYSDKYCDIHRFPMYEHRGEWKCPQCSGKAPWEYGYTTEQVQDAKYAWQMLQGIFFDPDTTRRWYNGMRILLAWKYGDLFKKEEQDD